MSETSNTPIIRLSTGTANRLMYLSPGTWEGKTVWVLESLYVEQGPCPGHVLSLNTHYGEPTGGLYCEVCCGFTRNLGLSWMTGAWFLDWLRGRKPWRYWRWRY